ncbi:MAG TPA: hypothetical protein VE733_14155 [Streptosporangiaceae bacterium]|jgi:hypothetical protein|nr:hypothetical protein [Streptosporangiaceae bacterium]
MTFALPMGLFIVVAAILYVLYTRPHKLPRLRYLASAHVAAVATPEAADVPRADVGTVVQGQLTKAARTAAASVGEMVSADSSSGAAGHLSDSAVIDGSDGGLGTGDTATEYTVSDDTASEGTE